MLKSLLILLNFSSQYSGVLQKEILTLFTYLNLVLAASQTKKMMKNNGCFLKSDGKEGKSSMSETWFASLLLNMSPWETDIHGEIPTDNIIIDRKLDYHFECSIWM